MACDVSPVAMFLSTFTYDTQYSSKHGTPPFKLWSFQEPPRIQPPNKPLNIFCSGRSQLSLLSHRTLRARSSGLPRYKPFLLTQRNDSCQSFSSFQIQPNYLQELERSLIWQHQSTLSLVINQKLSCLFWSRHWYITFFFFGRQQEETTFHFHRRNSAIMWWYIFCWKSAWLMGLGWDGTIWDQSEGAASQNSKYFYSIISLSYSTFFIFEH